MLTNFLEIFLQNFFHICEQNEQVPCLNFKSLFFTIILCITLFLLTSKTLIFLQLFVKPLRLVF